MYPVFFIAVIFLLSKKNYDYIIFIMAVIDMKTAGFAAVILAGGQSRRMGRNKAEITFNGKRTIDILAEKLKVFEDIMISSDRELEVEGCRNIRDIYKEKGPASGILSALRETKARALFVTACDMPLIKESTVKKICSIYSLYNEGNEEIDAAVIKTSQGINPLFGVYGKDTDDIFERNIISGELSVKKILSGMRVVLVDAETVTDDENEFLNMNTPDDCLRIKKVFYENRY